MATYVVRQSFTPPGGKSYKRGDQLSAAEAAKVPAALQARCLTPIADSPQPAALVPEPEKPAASKGA